MFNVSVYDVFEIIDFNFFFNYNRILAIYFLNKFLEYSLIILGFIFYYSSLVPQQKNHCNH